jgi:hypothetical protein
MAMRIFFILSLSLRGTKGSAKLLPGEKQFIFNNHPSGSKQKHRVKEKKLHALCFLTPGPN